MSPDRWQKIKGICDLALECDPDRRNAFLADACSGDEELSREVESILLRATSREGVLTGPVWQDLAIGVGAAIPASGPHTERWLPATIGRYTVLRLIGEGGMGAVYEAEQDQPRRVVALKIIKPGSTSPELLRRFDQESQALGRLHHPGIAQIYEAGTADVGFGPQPYFAMEFIRGEPLGEYAETHHLNARQRLGLLVKVFDGVDHAHQRGIIHRDLKPGNILVEESGQPKILDFGVARITDSDAQATRQTEMGQLVGTLAYMSPEQVLANPQELDERSDVYALGVILYELLANRLPYDIGHHPHEAVRAIREDDPTRLSSISRDYRGDVETIVAKALEKDKARRYPSAAALAADIRRYLADEPITARPASASYQLRKFARRHKTLAAATAVVFGVLVAGIVVSTNEAVRATRAEQTAQAVNDFLRNDLLAQAGVSVQASSGTKPDAHLEVRTTLDRAAARVENRFGSRPDVEAAIRDTIGQTYLDLGLYLQARTQLERALDLYRRTLGIKSRMTLNVIKSLAHIAELQGRYPEAEAILSEALVVQRRVLGPEHPDTLSSMNFLAALYGDRGSYAQTEELYSQILDIKRRVLGSTHQSTLISMANLGLTYEYRGKYEQAEALLSQTLEISRRTLGPEHALTAGLLADLASAYQRQGKYALAEAYAAQALVENRFIFGSEHPITVSSAIDLSVADQSQGKFAQSELLAREALEFDSKSQPDGWQRFLADSLLGASLSGQKKYREAEPLLLKGYQGMLARQQRMAFQDRYYLDLAREWIVQLYQDWGKPEQAAEWREKHPASTPVPRN
jgi:tetratricopeptide (TPR) repeat protein